jgi:zinc D-Ala-D-Ala dipeptidase
MIRCEDVAAHAGFRPLATVPDIVIDLRYARADNFMGHALYDGLDCAWLRVQAADGLARAAAWLAREHPPWRLAVLDALRPQRVQEALWARVQGTPMQAYLAHPQRGSIHSFGMAVDVTLVDSQGRECDMGSAFDEMSALSHPALEAQHLASGALTPEQVAARAQLRAAMVAGGFRGIRSEWWHFDFGDRDEVRAGVERVY